MQYIVLLCPSPDLLPVPSVASQDEKTLLSSLSIALVLFNVTHTVCLCLGVGLLQYTLAFYQSRSRDSEKGSSSTREPEPELCF